MATASSDQDALIASLSECITKHGFENDIQVVKYRETVCALAGANVDDKQLIKIEKEFSPDYKDRVNAFKEDVNKIAEGHDNVSIKVECLIKQGCQYDPISGIVPIEGGDPVTLEHVPGEVWLIDFWATWCPPCQAPMQHNETMLANNGAKWQDKVKIIGISIDQTAEAVVAHVKAKDWNRPIHYHRAKSNCSDVYQVRGVPHVMLIDTTGKIVFKGHPAGRPNLEDDFDKLLKGEALTGIEDEDGEKKPEGEAAAGDDTKDPAKCMEYIDKFYAEMAPGLQKDEELKEEAKKMPRAFCVMVYEQKLNVATGKTTIDWKNYRVLVGPGASVDKAKAKIEATLGENPGFEIVLREHKTD